LPGMGKWTDIRKSTVSLQLIKWQCLQKRTINKGSEGVLIKSFCGGIQGGQFLQKAPPLAAGGKKANAVREAEFIWY
jgi:hypothetical protein